MRCLRAALLAAAAAASPEVGPVADFVDAILHGRAVPLGLRRCPLAKACGADELAGAWLRTPQGRAYELSEGPTPSTIRVASDDGIRSASLPPGRAVCVGGVVPRSASPGILLHEGVGSTAGHFGEGCRTIEFDDGTTLYRPADRLPHGAADASASRGAPSKPDADAAVADAAVADDACSTVELEFVGASRPGASALREGWTSASARYQYVEAGGPVLRVEASIDSSGEVARLGSEVTALDDLGFCVGGVFLLNYTVAHARADEAVLHGSTGGMAELAPPGGNAPGNFSGTSAADTALQPWACPLCVDVASRPCPAQLTHATPDYEHEPSAARVASASSDLDGRSSNVQLPIFSVEVAPAGGGARRGLWLGPEYSGAWRLDAYAVESGTRLYVGLPTMLFTMRRGEAVALPRVAFGSWAASADAPLASDWSNAVRYAISRHLTPSVGGSRPVPFASYQGLGGLPEWQTEDELLRLSRRAGHRPGGLGLESFVFDAGLYYPLNATGCVDPAAPWCDHSAWWTRQGDYLPVRSRFPKRGFDSLARSITGPDGFDQMGSWITPQAQPGTSALDKRPELYLRPGPAPCACETSYVLNLALPAAQDFFFGQWVELIERFNNSRIWFDFNTAPRATHWNFHEERGRQVAERRAAASPRGPALARAAPRPTGASPYRGAGPSRARLLARALRRVRPCSSKVPSRVDRDDIIGRPGHRSRHDLAQPLDLDQRRLEERPPQPRAALGRQPLPPGTLPAECLLRTEVVVARRRRRLDRPAERSRGLLQRRAAARAGDRLLGRGRAGGGPRVRARLQACPRLPRPAEGELPSALRRALPRRRALPPSFARHAGGLGLR